MIFLAQNVYSIVDDNEKFAKRAFRCMTFCIKREPKQNEVNVYVEITWNLPGLHKMEWTNKGR